jgi:hypothetical protein
MTVLVGTMQLPVPEDADLVRAYLNGTHVSGGLWTGLTRASDHDHTGGVNGKPISVSSIPDGSITAGKLDPSVLLPYALVDGSKPFTGQVAMNSDAIVRDRLYFGAKPAGVADATLQRTGAGALRVDNRLGVGVDPIAWGAGHRALQVGGQGALWGDTGTTGAEAAYLSINTYFDGTSFRALGTSGGASLLRLQQGTLAYQTAPTAAQFGALTFTTRASIAPTGTLTLTPDAGTRALSAVGQAVISGSGGSLEIEDRAGPGTGRYQWLAQGGTFTIYDARQGKTRLDVGATGTLTLTPDAGQAALVRPGGDMILSSGGHIWAAPGVGGAHLPQVDNAHTSGHAAYRWSAVYAVAGAINTSSQEFKEGITPLSPAECYQAAKDVRWYEYAYRPPVYTAPEPPPDIAYDAADDNETKAEKKAARDEAEAASKAAHLKMVAETAPARHQRGFVFPVDGAEAKDELGGTLPPVPDLFGLSDRQSTTPQADLATLGAALQELIRRFEIVEAKVS